MNYNFKKAAQDSITLSPLMSGREKLDTEDVVSLGPVTIDEFDLAVVDDKQFAVLVFKEKPDCYYCGGIVLTKMVQVWVADFDGDIEMASAALRDSGGVTIRLTETRTKSGNNLTNVDIL